MTETKKRIIYERKGRLGQEDEKALDYAFWDEQGDDVRFQAAWDLVIQAYEIQGKNLDELRFQRSAEKLTRVQR